MNAEAKFRELGYVKSSRGDYVMDLPATDYTRAIRVRFEVIPDSRVPCRKSVYIETRPGHYDFVRRSDPTPYEVAATEQQLLECSGV